MPQGEVEGNEKMGNSEKLFVDHPFSLITQKEGGAVTEGFRLLTI